MQFVAALVPEKVHEAERAFQPWALETGVEPIRAHHALTPPDAVLRWYLSYGMPFSGTS